MIFKFCQGYNIRRNSFKMDISVNFTIPDKFYSLQDLGVFASHNQEVCDLLTSLGVTHNKRHSVRVTRDEVIVTLNPLDYDSVKTTLLRDKKLNDLLNG